MEVLSHVFMGALAFLVGRTLWRTLAHNGVAFAAGFVLFNCVMRPVFTALSELFDFFPLVVMILCIYELKNFGTPVVLLVLVLMKMYASLAWFCRDRLDFPPRGPQRELDVVEITCD